MHPEQKRQTVDHAKPSSALDLLQAPRRSRKKVGEFVGGPLERFHEAGRPPVESVFLVRTTNYGTIRHFWLGNRLLAGDEEGRNRFVSADQWKSRGPEARASLAAPRWQGEAWRR
jgi:hypothetical protein